MKLRLYILALCLALLLAGSGIAQQDLSRWPVHTLQSAAAATGNGTALETTPMSAVSVQVTGTFSATITFEGTVDGSNWIALMATNANDDTRATTATAAGIYSVVLNGCTQFRARVSTYASGSVTVKARLGNGLIARSSGGGGAPSGAAGGSLDGTYPNPGIATSVAGSGLSESTNVLAVNVDDSTIEISTDTLRVKDAGVTNAKLAGSITAAKLVGSDIATVGTITAGVWNGTAIGAQYGGTGINTSASTGYPSLSTGTWSIVNATTLTAALNAVVGDSGSGGTKGLVPAPAAGDAAASKFLKADGTWATAGGGLTVGTTAIASGAAGRFLYETSGNVLGEVSTLTSDGTILTFSPTVTTGTGTTSGLNANANSLTTGDAFNFASSSVSSGNVFKISATGTAAASNTKTALNVSTSGANGTGSQTTYGARFSNTSTGTSSTNVAGYFTASGGSNNYAIQVAAGTIIGDTSSQSLELSSGNGSILSYSNTKFFAGGSANVQIGAVPIQQWGTNSANLGPSTVLSWAASGSAANAADTYLRRNGAANIGLGATTAAAAPVAQTISVESVVGGTTNTAGATWKLIGSLGTSQGAPGVIELQAGALIAASGSTQQTAVSRLAVGPTKVLTNNTVTTLVNVTNASNTAAGGVIDYTVEVFDGTDVQTEVGSVSYMVTNKGGVWSGNTATKFGNAQNMTAGTLTVTWAISGANPALLSVNANSSLTPSTGYPRVSYNVRNLSQQAIAVQ